MNIIRTYRKHHNLTQEQLAAQLGVRQTLISNIERGARGISKGMALKLHTMDAEHFPLDRLLVTNSHTHKLDSSQCGQADPGCVSG